MLWLRAFSFLLFQGLVVGFVPFAVRRIGPHLPLGTLRYGGLALVASGVVLILWSDLAFVRHGRGTPAPYDPPRALVVHGCYRVVRNPMYVGAAVVVLGLAALAQSVLLLAYAAVVVLACHGLLLLVEEPRLQQRFGAPYTRYCRLVPRWIPRWPPIQRGTPVNPIR